LDHRKTLRLSYGTMTSDNDDDSAPPPHRDGEAASDSSERGGWGQLFSPEERFGGQLKALVGRLRNLRKEDGRIVVVTGQRARVADLWREGESFVPTVRDVLTPPESGSVLLVDGALGEGWRLKLPEGDVHLLTDAEIFGWHRPEPRRRKTPRRAR